MGSCRHLVFLKSGLSAPFWGCAHFPEGYSTSLHQKVCLCTELQAKLTFNIISRKQSFSSPIPVISKILNRITLSKETIRHLRSENADISFHTEHINPQLKDNTKRQQSYHTQLRDISKSICYFWPITTQRKHMQPPPSAGKRAHANYTLTALAKSPSGKFFLMVNKKEKHSTDNWNDHFQLFNCTPLTATNALYKFYTILLNIHGEGANLFANKS